MTDLTTNIRVIDSHFSQHTTAPEFYLKQRDLQKRVDTKFVMKASNLNALLSRIGNEYPVLKHQGSTSATYQNVYFDTPAKNCFFDHVRGKRIRHKFRIRSYPARQKTFLEIKSKIQNEATDKQKMELPFGHFLLKESEYLWLQNKTKMNVQTLTESMLNRYQRTTMFWSKGPERVTFDFSIEVTDPNDSNRQFSFGPLVVVEVKQEKFNAQTPLMKTLKELNIRPMSFSKYTMGVAYLFPGLKKNLLLPKLRKVNKVLA